MLNAVRGLSEYVSEEVSKMPFSWTNVGVSMYAQYLLQTKGVKMLQTFDNGEGFIDLDCLGEIVDKHAELMKDSTFKTPVGDLTITKDTPQQIMEHLKKYGEN
jgi:hypothetical protein